ncbi:MAG: divergent polysaccharide deacetylase family protein [Bacillota bacterium]
MFIDLYNKKLVWLLLIILVTLTACSAPSSDQSPEIKTVDYTALSQEIKSEVIDYWQQQSLDYSTEVTTKGQQQLKSGTELSWERYSKQIRLSFPIRRSLELDRILDKFRTNLTQQEQVSVEVEELESSDDLTRHVLRVYIEPEEVDDTRLLTYRLVLSQPAVEAKMAFVIDDLGLNRSGTAELMELDYPLTTAVLPQRSYSHEDALAAKRAGHQVLLHLPMEPLSDANPGAGAIYSDMSTAEIQKTIKQNLDSLGVKVTGVNNHMGSKVTADSQVMGAVLEYLKQKDLFFLDSSTAPQSVVAETSEKIGQSYGLNYLFIDNVDNKQQVKQQIKKLSTVALERGELITIGHIRPNTITAIEEMIPYLKQQRIQLVYLSQLIQ